MARKATSDTPPVSTPPVQPVVPVEAPTNPAPNAGGDGYGEDATPATQPQEPIASQASTDDSEVREQVKALVLHDSIYGKCGEVREFDAEHVSALKAAGYIDPHPKAVESAGG